MYRNTSLDAALDLRVKLSNIKKKFKTKKITLNFKSFIELEILKLNLFMILLTKTVFVGKITIN